MPPNTQAFFELLTPQLAAICASSLSKVAQQCQKEMESDLAAVGVREGQHLHLFYPFAREQRLLLEDALCGFPLLIPGEHIIIQDLQLLPQDMQPDFASALGLRSYLGVPLYLLNQRVGSLSVAYATPHQFTPAHRELLQHHADWVSELLQLYL